MRLVTFQEAGGLARAGAFIEGDQAVLDLRQAAQAVHGGSADALASVLSLIEAGPSASELARDLIARAPSAAVRERQAVKILAPIQPPPQMRDASCFELHLRQSFAAARKARAARTPDPEATLKAMNTRADDRVIETFQRQPIYYKCNRFATIGVDDDVIWPSYSKALDFELEFGFYIGARAKDVPKEKAREHIFGYTIFNDISARDAQAGGHHQAQGVVAGDLDAQPQRQAAPGEGVDRAGRLVNQLLDLAIAGNVTDLQVQGAFPVTAEQWAEIVHAKTNDPTLDPATAPARKDPKWEKFWTLRYSVLGAFKSPEERAKIPFAGAILLFDEPTRGIDVGAKISPILQQELGERFQTPAAFDKLIADGRKGKKTEKGFYLYGKNAKKGKKLVDETVYSVLGVTAAPRLNRDEISSRCMVQMLNEAVRTLEEGIIASARDGDIGAIFGIGFPPFLGGPFRYIDQLGAANLLAQLRNLESRFGSRFAPAPLLVTMAEQQQRFYP